MSTAIRTIALLIGLALCAGGLALAQQPSVFPKVNIASLDRNGLRTVINELLRTYSPSGKYIIDRCGKMPTSFVIGNTTFQTNATDCMAYIKGRTMDDVVSDLPIAVHEMTHDYQLRAACAMLAEQKIVPKGAEYHAIYTGDQTILVKGTKVYRTCEMQGLFPAELRTTRFPVYVFPGRETSAQSDGIYGLLDEFDAYYMGMKTALDCLPYYEASAKTPEQWFAFFNMVNREYFAYAEFKLYILNYLRYAKANHPDVYTGILGNADFKRAFCTVEAKYGQLMENYFTGKQRIFAHLHTAGYQIDEDDEYIRVYEQDGSYTGRSNFLGTYKTLLAELAKAECQEMMAALRK